MCIAYGVLFILFTAFFNQKISFPSSRSLLSLGWIFVASTLLFAISMSVRDPELGNRILHTFGGGFMSMLICFLVVRDSQLGISKFQFFIFSVLIVMSLGIANELLEFYLQMYAHIIFATSIQDTWLDLASNLVGALIGSVCFVSFVGKKKI